MRLADAVASLRARLMLLVCRGVIKLVNDSLGIQKVQASGLREELFGALERWGCYGITSRPHPGAEGLFLFQGGSRDLGFCIAVEDRRYRLQGLQTGEVALYDDLGSVVKLKRGGIIEIQSAEQVRVTCGVQMRVEAPMLRVVGNVDASGDVTDNSGTAQTMAAMRAVFNSHTHPGGGGPSAPM